MPKKFRFSLDFSAGASIISMSCRNCQTCTKTIGGFAGNEVVEQRQVCSDAEAETLEKSSSGTTVWACE